MADGKKRGRVESVLLALCCMSAEPLEVKLPLLFDVYDLDRSGALSMLEMTQIAAMAAALHGAPGRQHPSSPTQAGCQRRSRARPTSRARSTR